MLLWFVLPIERAAAAHVVEVLALPLSECQVVLTVDGLDPGSRDDGVLLICVDKAEIVGAEDHGREHAAKGSVYEEVRCLVDGIGGKYAQLEG